MIFGRAAIDAVKRFRDLVSKEIERGGKAISGLYREVGSTPAHRAADMLENDVDRVTVPLPRRPRLWLSTIDERSAELGLCTPAQHALESSLLIDEPIHDLAIVVGQPHPGMMFGEREWAGYLDARAFARQHSDRKLGVSFIAELHRRLSRFSKPDIGGMFAHSRRLGIRGGGDVH